MSILLCSYVKHKIVQIFLGSSSKILAIYLQDASIDPSEVFNRIVSSVSVLLTKDEVA